MGAVVNRRVNLPAIPMRRTGPSSFSPAARRRETAPDFGAEERKRLAKREMHRSAISKIDFIRKTGGVMVANDLSLIADKCRGQYEKMGGRSAFRLFLLEASKQISTINKRLTANGQTPLGRQELEEFFFHEPE